MKNILLVTSLYPCDDIRITNNTSVCHYFAIEWMKMGYHVRVIFNYNVYPRFFYPLMRVFRKQMSNIFGVSIQDVFVGNHIRYEKDGIQVDLLPIKKARPGAGFSDEVIKQQELAIRRLLEKDDYKPDFVLGHFTHPNLELVVRLKEYYGIKGTIALHGAETGYSEDDAKQFDKVDMVGYRSYPTKWAFEKLYGEKAFFMCPSGVPGKFITQPRVFKEPVSKFIYVGTFMRRKYASCLVPAIAKTYGDEPYSMTFVGDGYDKSQIVKKAIENDCTDKVFFTGRISRDEIWKHLDTAEVFIMISKIETFGLVYLEAMARGCIVVASKNEGMDGIIEDGVNGFLCEAGNEVELQGIVERIRRLTLERLNALSVESIKTAKKYTDHNVAETYIKAIDNN